MEVPPVPLPGTTADSGADAPDVVRVALRRLDPDLPVPAYARAGDAGADLLARHDARLPPGGRATVATGVALALPEGYAAFVHPRSGLAARHGVTTLNGPGTVDAGYRGEVLVTLVNTDPAEAFAVRRGDRIAQLVVQRVARAEFAVVEELPASARGTRGHGSTGGWSTAAPAAGDAGSATLGTASQDGVPGSAASGDRTTTSTGAPAGRAAEARGAAGRSTTAPGTTTAASTTTASTTAASTTAASTTTAAGPSGRTETTAGGRSAAGEEQP